VQKHTSILGSGSYDPGNFLPGRLHLLTSSLRSSLPRADLRTRKSIQLLLDRVQQSQKVQVEALEGFWGVGVGGGPDLGIAHVES
jgi:hypothetical protein